MESKKSSKVFFVLSIILFAICLGSVVLFIPDFRANLIYAAGDFLGKTLDFGFWNNVLLVMEKGLLSICLILSVFFFMLWKSNKFSLLMTNEKNIFVTTCKEIGSEIKSKTFLKYLLILTCILLVSVIALIRANALYCDDVYRNYEGAGGWTNFSRYVTFILANFVHGWIRLADISPLPQILSVIISIFTCMAVVYILTPDRKFTVSRIVAVLPLVISPYFLQCISYKYDAPYMSLSLFFSIIPVLFAYKDLLLFGIVTFISTLLVCTSYQAALGIFPILVLFLCLQEYKKDKINFKRLFTAVGGYLAALIFFKLFLMVEHEAGYVSTSTPSIGQMIPTFFKNLVFYYTTFWNDSNILWKLLVLIIGITYFVTYIKTSKKNKAATLGIFVLFSGFIFCLVFGIYPLLNNPSSSPRGMIGIGAFIAFMNLVLLSDTKCFHAKLVTFAFSWCLFGFCFTYGNALAEQKKYEDFRLQQVITDLNDIPEFADENIKNVEIVVDLDLAPSIVNNAGKSYPVLNTLVKESAWTAYYFFNYYNFKNVNRCSLTDEEKAGLNLIQDTMYHSIYGNDNKYLILLK